MRDFLDMPSLRPTDASSPRGAQHLSRRGVGLGKKPLVCLLIVYPSGMVPGWPWARSSLDGTMHAHAAGVGGSMRRLLRRSSWTGLLTLLRIVSLSVFRPTSVRADRRRGWSMRVRSRVWRVGLAGGCMSTQAFWVLCRSAVGSGHGSGFIPRAYATI